ncbi:MAG TPA: aldo/keto reductase [Candidatus Binatia bacterium]|nr:aldo/keto reductase [Candidatus Binatia bacterium]
MQRRRLGRTNLDVTPLGIGLAAVGRPGYITLGRDRDLGSERSPEALYARSAAVLDAARAAGVHYFDAARSYGRAEEFLARWLADRGVGHDEATVGSKWGYRYTAGWAVDAPVHEQKELSVERFHGQLEETRALLGGRLGLYQIHSATAESGALEDARLLDALVTGRREGAYRAVGLSLSGPGSARTLALARRATALGEPVFDVVQATCNVLEPSLAPALAEARAAGMGVIVKEVHANGRLTDANDRPQDAALIAWLRVLADGVGLGIDQLAVAFATGLPGIDVVLSGAATPAQLASHVAALDRVLAPETRDTLASFAESPDTYWAVRSSLPWS